MKIIERAFCSLRKVCLALLASLLVITTAQSQSSDPPVGFVLHPSSWADSFIVYTKAFAKRFGLDEKKAMPLSKGLLAMQVIVKQSDKLPPFNKENGMNALEYDCNLNLFVDSNLAIRYPDNLPYSSRQAAAGVAGAISSSFAHMNPDERQALWEKLDNDYNSVTVGIFYKALNKKGLISTNQVSWVTMVGYAQEPLKGISYIRMSPACEQLTLSKKDRTPITLWFKKKNYKKYNQLEDGEWKPNVQAYYHFQIPLQMSQWPYIKYGDCVNLANIEAYADRDMPNFKPRKCTKPN